MLAHSSRISCATALLLSASGDDPKLASEPCGVIDSREAADCTDFRLELESDRVESFTEEAALGVLGCFLRTRRAFLPLDLPSLDVLDSASTESIVFKCMRVLFVSSIFFMIRNSSCVMLSYSYIRSMFESLARGLLLRKKRFLNIFSNESIALSISEPLMKLLSHTTLTLYIVAIQVATFFFRHGYRIPTPKKNMALRLEEDADPTSDYLPDSQTSSDSESDGGGSEEASTSDKYSIYEKGVATMVAKRQMYLRNNVKGDEESESDETPPKQPGKGKGKAKEEPTESKPNQPARKRVKKEAAPASPSGFLFD